MGSLQTEAEKNVPYVAVIDVEPGLADPREAELNFEAQLNMNPKAIILLSYATGATPETLNPFIKKCTDKGIPIYLLSKNPASHTGIQKISYGPQMEAIKAGATPLRDVNVNHVLDVVDAIQTAVNKGLSGNDLNNAIIDKYGTAAPTNTR